MSMQFESLLAGLENFSEQQKVSGNKGPLAAILSITRQARTMGWPLDHELMLTKRKGQVKGVGKAGTQAVLLEFGITRVLAEEGGRTSRGIMLLMQDYFAFLNSQYKTCGSVDLVACENFWIGKVKNYFASKPFVLKLDPSWGVRKAVRYLTTQAVDRQREATGAMFLGTMMQHLVGAKLDVALTLGSIDHHSANQSDQRPDRHGDFDIEDVAIHVSTAPSEALVRKCNENLGKGKRPVIITTRKGMLTAEGLLENAGVADRVDLIEFEQFIATNVFEMGRFSANGRRDAFQRIVDAYNVIVDDNETDPGLRIEMTAGK